MEEVGLYEILITPKTSDAMFALKTDMYNIESTNTTESRIKSISTSEGNEHTVQKLSDEGTIMTKVREGIFQLSVEDIESSLTSSIARTNILVTLLA